MTPVQFNPIQRPILSSEGRRSRGSGEDRSPKIWSGGDTNIDSSPHQKKSQLVMCIVPMVLWYSIITNGFKSESDSAAR